MSWFFQTSKVFSEKNGEISCVRWLGRWSIYVNGYDQTSDYTATMWRQAMQRLPEDTTPRKVLILGLGLGNCLSIVKKKFPKSEVIFVEWDPVMVDLARRCGYLKGNDTRVIIGDAMVVLGDLQDSFDLILVDLFRGDKAIVEESIFSKLTRLVSPTGLLLVNAFKDLPILKDAEQYFEKEQQWRFRFNTLALFHPIGWLSPRPIGYVPFRASPLYVEAESRAYKSKQLIGSTPALGHRLHVFFQYCDQYVGDDEPSLGDGPKRWVQWQRITRRDVPEGWEEVYKRIGPRMTGYADLNEAEAIGSNWHPRARRHLKRWREATSNNWEVVDVSVDEFIDAYKKWRWDPLLVYFFIRHFKKQLLAHGDNVKWFCVRRRDTVKIEAGFVSLDIPELKQSIHLISFIYDSAKKDSVGVGAIYEWFVRARERGIRFMDFDNFWVPGTFVEWRGFSEFKDQFGTRYVRYPNLLERKVPKT